MTDYKIKYKKYKNKYLESKYGGGLWLIVKDMIKSKRKDTCINKSEKCNELIKENIAAFFYIINFEIFNKIVNIEYKKIILFNFIKTNYNLKKIQSINPKLLLFFKYLLLELKFEKENVEAVDLSDAISANQVVISTADIIHNNDIDPLEKLLDYEDIPKIPKHFANMVLVLSKKSSILSDAILNKIVDDLISLELTNRLLLLSTCIEFFSNQAVKLLNDKNVIIFNADGEFKCTTSDMSTLLDPNTFLICKK
jgi:hypothetical protein